MIEEANGQSQSNGTSNATSPFRVPVIIPWKIGARNESENETSLNSTWSLIEEINRNENTWQVFIFPVAVALSIFLGLLGIVGVIGYLRYRRQHQAGVSPGIFSVSYLVFILTSTEVSRFKITFFYPKYTLTVIQMMNKLFMMNKLLMLLELGNVFPK